MSLRARATLACGLGLALAVGLAVFFVYAATRAEMRAQVDQTLQAGAQALGRDFVAQPVRADRPSGHEGGARAPRKGTEEKRTAEVVLGRAGTESLSLAGVRGFSQFVTSGGPVVRDGEPGPFRVSERAVEVATGERKAFYSDIREGGVHLRVFTMPVRDGLAVQVARSVDETDRVLRRLRAMLLLALLGGIALAALIGLAVATTMLAPVRRLTAAAERIAMTRKLDEPIAEDRKDELGRLARSFNSMLAALRASVAAQRQLVADASHELRTPLTSILTNVEVLGDEPTLDPKERRALVDETTAQVRELGTLVGNLVELARVDQPPAQIEQVRLDDVVRDCVERARMLWPGITFRASVDESPVVGDRDALERAVRNLLENAAKWSPAGGRVDVHVANGEVLVRDEGPGIDEADLPHVFDRFYRAPTARAVPGSGLGLSIVRQVAETHGGAVSAERAARGATFRLRIPVTVAG